jgi:hypothetical protein
MIILEGPDGSGKSNLARRLNEQLGIPLHERASSSKEGPVENLWAWTVNDVGSWSDSHEPVAIYDRHPLISEYIYGPTARGQLKPGFTHPAAGGMIRKMQQCCLLVLCLPPLETVRRNVLNEDVPQMAGVVAQIDSIWWQYAGLASSWGGWMVTYDYEQREGHGKKSHATVVRSARLHAATWRRERMMKA